MVVDLKLLAHPDAGLSQAQLADHLANKRHEMANRVVVLEQQVVVKDDCSLADAADAASLQENRLRAAPAP